MANDSSDIVVKISDTESAAMVSSMEKAGVNVKSAGDYLQAKGRIGQGGAFIISESCEEAARSFGLPFPVANKLGDAALGLALSFGMFATGIGAVIIAASLAYAAYNKYADMKKEHRETLELSVEGMKGEVLALYDRAGISDEVQRATYDLANAKRRLMQALLPRLIKDLNEKLKEENKKFERNKMIIQQLTRLSRAKHRMPWEDELPGTEELSNKVVQAELGSVTQKYINKQAATIEVIKKTIAAREVEQKTISATPPSLEEQRYPILARMQDRIAGEKALLDMQLSNGLLSLEERSEQEIKIFTLECEQDIALLRKNAALQDQLEARQNLHNIEQQILMNNQLQRAITFKIETAKMVIDGIFSVLDMFIDQSSDAEKTLYYVKRANDAITAGANYWTASRNATNYYVAIFYVFMAIAVPIAIMAEDIDGMGGTDPATGFSIPKGAGMDSGKTKKSRTINIIINGKKTNSFEQTAGWVHKQLPPGEKVEDQFVVSSSLN